MPDHLRSIRAAQAIGLTLEDIATLLDFREDRTANRDFVDERRLGLPCEIP